MEMNSWNTEKLWYYIASDFSKSATDIFLVIKIYFNINVNFSIYKLTIFYKPKYIKSKYLKVRWFKTPRNKWSKERLKIYKCEMFRHNTDYSFIPKTKFHTTIWMHNKFIQSNIPTRLFPKRSLKQLINHH